MRFRGQTLEIEIYRAGFVYLTLTTESFIAGVSVRSVFDPSHVDLSVAEEVKRERDMMTEKNRGVGKGGRIGSRMQQIRAPLCEKPFWPRYRRTEGESNFEGKRE